MKRSKIAVLAAATVLTLGVAGNAMASFSYGDLMRFTYDSSTATETGTDLGTVSSFLTPGAVTTTTSAISSGYLTSTTANVSYLAYDSANKVLYVAAPSGNDGVEPGKFTAGDNTALSAIISGYQLKAGTASEASLTGIGASGSPSFYRNMDKNGSATGTYSQFITDSGYAGETSLADLANTGTLSLYKFDVSKTSVNLTGTEVATLTTNADGTLTATSLVQGQVAATPIPAAFYLMGSGLMGLVGLRRKKA
jgi:hypothetical protein